MNSHKFLYILLISTLIAFVNSRPIMFPAIMHLTVDTTQANLVTNTRQQSKISTTIGTTEELSSRTTPQTTTTVLPTQAYLTTPDLCDLNSTPSSWNDIIILLEYTRAVGEEGISVLTDQIREIFSNYTLCTFDLISNCTRLGIILYSDKVEDLYQLGSIDQAVLQKLNISSNLNMDTIDINLDGAIIDAALQFSNSKLHRVDSRKVIMIMASTVSSYSNILLANFKENGGKIIVYQLIQDIDNASPIFKKIASKGYYISSLSNNSIIQVSEAIMRANCFCNAPMSAYHYELPVADSSYANGGCYSLQITATSFDTASSSCQRIGANVASLKDYSKAGFILSFAIYRGFKDYQSIWIDLHEIGGVWKWGDGQQLSSTDYCGNITSTKVNEYDNCAVFTNVQNQYRCMAVPCIGPASFICEANPIDASNFQQNPYLH